MKFICGCSMPPVESLQGDPELKTLAMCSYDEDGFLICKVHRQRRYGWASLPEQGGGRGRRLDYSYASFSEYEIERRLLFDEPLPRVSVMVVKNGGLDRRDNRDPELLETSARVDAELLRHLDDISFGSSLPSRANGRALMEYQRQLATRIVVGNLSTRSGAVIG